jgi:hypothetical protein
MTARDAVALAMQGKRRGSIIGVGLREFLAMFTRPSKTLKPASAPMTGRIDNLLKARD